MVILRIISINSRYLSQARDYLEFIPDMEKLHSSQVACVYISVTSSENDIVICNAVLSTCKTVRSPFSVHFCILQMVIASLLLSTCISWTFLLVNKCIGIICIHRIKIYKELEQI